MKAMDLLYAMSWAGDEDILTAQNPVRKKTPKIWLVAAVLSATALLVGCTAAYVLHVRNMKLGEETHTVLKEDSIIIDKTPEGSPNRQITVVEGEGPAETQEITREVFSITGWQGTPEYQALREWYDYQKEFDPDHSKYSDYTERWREAYHASPDFKGFYPEPYNEYGVYDDAMVEKLDEIAAKYGLSLLSPWMTQEYTWEEPRSERLTKFSGVEHFFHEDSGAKMEFMGTASVTEEKAFYVSFSLRMPWENQEYPALSAIYYTPRGVFSDDWFSLSSDEKWEEFNYTTRSGDPVLIVYSLEGVNSWIFCQRSDGFIALRVESRMDVFYEDENGTDHADCTFMTKEQLQEIADAVDFSFRIDPDWEFVRSENAAYQKNLDKMLREQWEQEHTGPTEDGRDG